MSAIISKATEVFFNTPPSEGEKGMDATFVRLKGNGNIGVKVYHKEEKRNRQVAIQSHLAYYGLAPEVYGTFDLPVSVDEYDNHDRPQTYRYAMITECVKSVGYEGSYDEYCMDSEAQNESYMVEREFNKELLNVGILAVDMHCKNWGYNENGEKLVIDVGHCRVDEEWFEDRGLPPLTWEGK